MHWVWRGAVWKDFCNLWIYNACTSECQICISPIIHIISYILVWNAQKFHVLPKPQSPKHHEVITGEVLTSIVVTVSVLLANDSDALMSKDVEFIANVLLEYQTPICTWNVKKFLEDALLQIFCTVRTTCMNKSVLNELNNIKSFVTHLKTCLTSQGGNR